MMRFFVFSRDKDRTRAWIERPGRQKRYDLKPRDDLWPFTRHWGCGDTSNETYRFALAILCVALGVDQLAMHLAGDFTTQVLAFADPDNATIAEDMVVQWSFENLEDQLFPKFAHNIQPTEPTHV